MQDDENRSRGAYDLVAQFVEALIRAGQDTVSIYGWGEPILKPGLSYLPRQPSTNANDCGVYTFMWDLPMQTVGENLSGEN